MPDDFNFVFKYGVETKSVLDTVHDKYTKDLVIDGLITTDLVLSNEDKIKIYEYMRSIDFFDYPEEVEGALQKPLSGYRFEIMLNGEKKIVNWRGEFNPGKPSHNDFKQLTKMVIGMIEANEAYQSLPEPNGGYE